MLPTMYVSLNQVKLHGLAPLSKHVETQLQLHVEQLPGIQQLWRVAGAGGPKGNPPYCVGVRFIPHEADGSLPNGFYHTIPRS